MGRHHYNFLTHVDDGASGLLLQGGSVSGILGFLAVYFYAVVSHTPLLSPLEHVVGPLRAAASLAVDEAPSASWEGAPASSTVVYPGFLAVAIVVLGKTKDKATTLGQGLPCPPHKK